MSHKRFKLAFCWVFLWGVLPVVCAGAFEPDDSFSRETLRGLGPIYVLIEHLKPNAERAGLTTKQIKTEVELRLRKAGIRVLTQQENLATPGMPYLYIAINSSQGRAPLSDLIAFCVNVELKQNASLVRNTAITAFGASTWSREFLVGLHREDARQIREHVSDLVDTFINDYLSVNRR